MSDKLRDVAKVLTFANPTYLINRLRHGRQGDETQLTDNKPDGATRDSREAKQKKDDVSPDGKVKEDGKDKENVKEKENGKEKKVEETYTVDDAVNKIGLGRFQAYIFIVLGLLKCTEAMEVLLLAVLAPLLRCAWLLSDAQVALITTVVFLGMFIGSAAGGVISDIYGRRPVIVMSAVWVGYMGFLTAFSPSYPWVLILRGLIGIGFGGSVQAFTLLAEYMPTKRRAIILIASSMMWKIGTLLEIMLSYFVAPTMGWQWLVALTAVPTFLILLPLLSMPESARYLAAAGEKEKAINILSKAARWNRTSLPKGTLIQTKEEKQGALKELFRGRLFRNTLQTWFIWFGTAFSAYGIALLSSEPRLLNHPQTCSSAGAQILEAGESCRCVPVTKEHYITTLITIFGEFAAIPIILLTMDTLGRRITLVINFLGAALFFLLIQLCTSSTWMTIFIFAVRAFIGAIFPTVYIYTSEVYPTTLRSSAIGSSSACARIGVMITPFVSEVLLNHSVPMAMCVYGVVNILCAICSALLPIETKGKALEQSV